MEMVNTSGRRKTAVARVYFGKGKGNIIINGRDYKTYFPSPILQYKITQAFGLAKEDVKGFDVKVNVMGGGINGQAEAIRLAIAKAFVEMNPDSKKELRAHGLITRDPRMVERKKFGRKKARKRFQFSKR